MKAKYVDDVLLNESTLLHAVLAIGGLWCIYGILKEVLKMKMRKMISNYSDPEYLANKEAELSKRQLEDVIEDIQYAIKHKELEYEENIINHVFKIRKIGAGYHPVIIKINKESKQLIYTLDKNLETYTSHPVKLTNEQYKQFLNFMKK